VSAREQEAAVRAARAAAVSAGDQRAAVRAARAAAVSAGDQPAAVRAARGDAVSARELAAAVLDPELPLVTIEELGILRRVDEREGRVTVTITPTYSGCPAMDAIRADIVAALSAGGYDDVSVSTELGQPWTSDWITPAGRVKLATAGIAPPGPAGGPVGLTLAVRCPRCGSPETEELSRFGATACKALWRCRACREPFERVKAI
jgi:ring-1,2-phenylacetyl-CoA epoxidase subunit PaaD